MKKKLSILRKTGTIIFLTFIYILLIELLTRTSLLFITSNQNIFFYGINKNFTFEVTDLTELKFNINDNNEQNKKGTKKTDPKLDKKILESKVLIWAFGASLTYGYSCGKDSSSWPDELKKLNENFKVVNFGFPSIYSDNSIKILNYNLNNKKINKPDIILWAHRDEEKLPLYLGINRNKDKIKKKFSYNNKKQNIKILRFEKTLESNFTSFIILKHIITKLKKRNNVYQESSVNYKFNENDYLIAIENYLLNTQEAINNARNKNIKKFKIISLFADDDLNLDNDNMFLRLFMNSINKFALKNQINIIDTLKFLNKNDKNDINLFFCENKHFSLHGNQRIAEIIYNNIIN
tara:strand:+ start:1520 stop:2569 length:1050 start_codon:yes stop_codon:yes gene_type:complete